MHYAPLKIIITILISYIYIYSILRLPMAMACIGKAAAFLPWNT